LLFVGIHSSRHIFRRLFDCALLLKSLSLKKEYFLNLQTSDKFMDTLLPKILICKTMPKITKIIRMRVFSSSNSS
jgi:hypothetical protein